MVTSKRRTRNRAFAQIAIWTVLWPVAAGRAETQCRPRRVAIIGDSITLGRNDSEGGFPTRAGVILQASPATFTTVLNRGIGGATTGSWLGPPSKANWDRFAQLHPDLTGAKPPDVSMAEAVASLDRPLDTIVIVLGVNDRVFHGRSAPQVAANLHSLQERLRPFADAVLISTLLPSTNPIAEVGLAEMNEVIRAEFPDFFPLGDAFRDLPNWPDLLEQSVHPTEKGHAALASIAASQLVARGLAGALSRPPTASCECYPATHREHAFVPTDPDRTSRLGNGGSAPERPFALCVPSLKANQP